jgi:hypothetical protein
MTLSDTAAHNTGHGSTNAHARGGDRPSQDDVARLAYHLYETNGRQDGRDLDDWLSAERELQGSQSLAES